MIPIVAPFVPPPGPARCQHCGAILQASTPAADPPKDASGDRGVVPSAPPKKHNESWRDREPLL